MALNDPDVNKTREVLLEKIRKDKRKLVVHRIYGTLKYAAMVLILLSLGYLVNQNFSDGNSERVVPRKDAITVQLGNGETKVITDKASIKITDPQGNVIGHQKGNSLIYRSNKNAFDTSENSLNIPFGRKFDLVLSDGTKVFLNSGSTLRYPTNFNGKINREVHLTGEAYFDVARDVNKPFLVNSQEVQVQVLGTQFNISNYSEDTDTEVVLVEGSVNMRSMSNARGGFSQDVLLKPGHKGTYDRLSDLIVTEVVDVSRYISWIQGREIFVDAPFENIIKKLERQYNVIIINKNNQISKERFTATIETDRESIEQVMSFFNRVYEIEYRLVDNKIIIE